MAKKTIDDVGTLTNPQSMMQAIDDNTTELYDGVNALETGTTALSGRMDQAESDIAGLGGGGNVVDGNVESDSPFWNDTSGEYEPKTIAEAKTLLGVSGVNDDITSMTAINTLTNDDGLIDIQGLQTDIFVDDGVLVGVVEEIGLTWIKIEMGAGLEFIRSLAYCGNGIVLAGSGSGSGDGDVYRSTDYGLTWVLIEVDIALEYISSIVYCGNGICLAGSGYSTGDGDIYRSDDYGLTWSKIEMGAGLEFIQTLTCCGNGGIILAGSGSGPGDGDVHRSDDYGLTWTPIEMGTGLEFIVSLTYCSNGICLAGSGSGTGDGDIYKSTDYGLTWTKIEMGAGLEFIRSLAYCGNGICLAGAANSTGDGDIYRSTVISDLNTTINTIEIILDGDPAEHTGSGIITIMTVDANTYGIASALHVDTDGNLIEANATAITTMPCTALALETGTGSKKVLFNGFMRDNTWNWTPGVPIYMSTTVGSLSAVAPSGTANQVQVVGVALTADSIYFNPSFNLVEIA